MNDMAIIVKNVSKVFNISQSKGVSKLLNRFNDQNSLKKLSALSNISFSLPKGEILSIIGKNGSGKSTLLRTIAGVYRPTSGEIKVNGSMSPLMQLGAGFQPELNARENIIINGMLLGLSKSSMERKVEKILYFAELENFVNLKLKQYSTGMRARLAFGISLEIDPDILLVDEILSVGDKNFQKKSYNAFLDFKKKKKTILHATHNIGNLSKFSDKVLLLDKGKMVMIGKPEEVIEKYENLK